MAYDVAVYLRSADPNVDSRYTDRTIFDYFKKHDNLTLSETLNTAYMYWDDCLGKSDPLQRDGYASLLADIAEKHIKTLYMNDLTVISTVPKELAIRLYDLVRRGVKVVSVEDGITIDSNNIREFKYGCVLARVGKQLAQNDNNRFELLVHKKDRYKIWHDTLEETFYYESANGLEYIELVAAIEKDKWDNVTLSRKEYEILCQAKEYSQFCEVITRSNTSYYVHFYIDDDALESGCTQLDDEVLNESQKVITRIYLRQKGILH